MELKDTIEMMQSAEYRERFKAEYQQNKIRTQGLRKMLTQWSHGVLKFDPVSSEKLLTAQLKAMEAYGAILEERARIEKIRL